MKNTYEASFREVNSDFGGEDRTIIASSFDEAVAKAKRQLPRLNKDYESVIQLAGVRLRETNVLV